MSIRRSSPDVPKTRREQLPTDRDSPPTPLRTVTGPPQEGRESDRFRYWGTVLPTPDSSHQDAHQPDIDTDECTPESSLPDVVVPGVGGDKGTSTTTRVRVDTGSGRSQTRWTLLPRPNSPP